MPLQKFSLVSYTGRAVSSSAVVLRHWIGRGDRMAFLLCFSNSDSSCSSCEYTRLVLIISLTRKYTEWLGRTCRSHQRRYEAFCVTFACEVHFETGDWHEGPEGQILHLDEKHASSSLRRIKFASLQSVRHVYLEEFTERPVSRVLHRSTSTPASFR